jgi:hypothetical protein
VFADVGMFISGGGTLLPNAPPPVVATFGFGPRLALRIPFAERFAFRAFADLRIAPIESSYNFINDGSRWTSSVVSGLFGIGLSFE